MSGEIAVGGLIVLAVIFVIAACLCFWNVAGYICTTLNWFAIDPNAQWFLFGAFVLSGGLVGWKK